MADSSERDADGKLKFNRMSVDVLSNSSYVQMVQGRTICQACDRLWKLHIKAFWDKSYLMFAQRFFLYLCVCMWVSVCVLVCLWMRADRAGFHNVDGV